MPAEGDEAGAADGVAAGAGVVAGRTAEGAIAEEAEVVVAGASTIVSSALLSWRCAGT
ncbi:hypothetical protein Phou_025190 [Phytohabitans houttuyneae]|uniref:Uncharacterized protein n=1 Tax=Phytohabitans houttuyneae TaxID=1076126 RepID=A0A6V8K889_9ACTN|nr:hypothetical protein Phou_025190 [Phytohabitans houttuyneae]